MARAAVKSSSASSTAKTPKNEVVIKVRPHHRGQKHVAKTERRFNVLACGRRFGKTEYGKTRVYKALWEGKRVAWFSPTYRMMGEVWRSIIRKLKPVISFSNAAEHRLELHNGATLEMWSLDNYEAIRGRKYHLAIIDEAAVVRNLQDAWQAVIRPTLVDYKGQAYFLSTPKGNNYFKELFDLGQDEENEEWMSWQMPTASNPYIDELEIEAMRAEMTSRLFEQEIMASFVADMEGALWTRVLLDETRVRKASEFERIVVGVDPGVSATSEGETGIVVAGLAWNGDCYILEDSSISGSPETWGKQVISAYERWSADRIVVEINQGGDMVAATLRTIDPFVPITEVRASRGKATRAEPVVALYEQDMVHHVGNFPLLENQLCSWVPGEKSPDRLDALVWSVWSLKLMNDIKKVASVRSGKVRKAVR